jgi:AraC-like DNA-binding protein
MSVSNPFSSTVIKFPDPRREHSSDITFDLSAPLEMQQQFFETGGLSFECLARTLRAAGIDPQGVPQTPDNIQRLAAVAQLFGIELPESDPLADDAGPNALPKWRLKRVTDYIEANICERLLLPDLAAIAGLSRMYFASQFRISTGLRPHDYVLQRRIARAQALMSKTSLSLVDVAFDVGFQTQAHFTTAFKKLVGMPPARWRRNRQCLT